jgi:hypothetical protein
MPRFAATARQVAQATLAAVRDTIGGMFSSVKSRSKEVLGAAPTLRAVRSAEGVLP